MESVLFVVESVQLGLKNVRCRLESVLFGLESVLIKVKMVYMLYCLVNHASVWKPSFLLPCVAKNRYYFVHGRANQSRVSRNVGWMASKILPALLLEHRPEFQIESSKRLCNRHNKETHLSASHGFHFLAYIFEKHFQILRVIGFVLRFGRRLIRTFRFVLFDNHWIRTTVMSSFSHIQSEFQSGTVRR
jgi:hypothetical protein